MKREAGLWIDHCQAVIVLMTSAGEEVKRIESKLEKHIRFSSSSHSKTPAGLKEVTTEDQRDRQFEHHLNQYYDDVIACLRQAEAIQLFGPGEAKAEFEKRLESKELGGRIVGIETVDKMTDRQIAAKVRQHFLQPAVGSKPGAG